MPPPIRRSRGRGVALVALPLLAFLACGETRRPIGEECLRDDDCLSGVCSARACVPAPPLVAGAVSPPDDRPSPLPLPDDAAAAPDAPTDAPGGG
ncbi:MAG: hypothetical protein KC657_04665 [Myxococcales bacterium]|nr:hypothetical protein [Myxococcales bacterium]